jgi:hypothetical protein
MYFKESDMDINRNNYETSFLLYLDRELVPADMLKVEKFLTENPDLQKEFLLLQQTIFQPENITYDQKERLFHKEEKRRIIPRYWMRIAASVIFLMAAGGFILVKVLNNHQGEMSAINQNTAKLAPLPGKQVPEIKDIKNDNQPDQLVKKDITENNKRINQTPEKEVAKKTVQINQGTAKEVSLKNNSAGMPQKNDPIPVTDESSVAYQKSNAASELQPDGLRAGTDPKQISAQPGTGAAALVLVSADSKDQIKVENTDLKQENLQADNAISVVALDDQNKAIAGFFKKLISRNPDDDKTNNTRKVRVSVFQLSY